MSCMCGAWDCESCRPDNFRHGKYIGDIEDFDADKADAAAEDKAADEYEDYQDWIDYQGEIRGECSDYKN